MNELLNPYIAGAPVVETSMFFGREDVFGWIERSLAGKFVDHILVLHGQRRVGKTSVLKQIPNFLPDKYIQVFFDLQGRTGTTLDRFLWWLASEIARTLKREHDINIPKPDREAFEDTEYLINEFLPSLRPILGDRILLLTFDEFDSLDRPEIRDTLTRPLIVYLRRLIESDGLNFIFSIGSSGDKLENMQASYTDFFKSALYRKISFLTRDDCQRLITKPVEGVIKYEKKAVDRIAEITSGHPYFTQLMCHELFSRCQKTGDRVISAEDVEAILEDVVERGTVNLKFIWDEASDLEKWTLAALAHMDGGSNQKLTQSLTAQRVRFSDSDLNSATIHLRDKDVITTDNRFVIHLMRLWLVANRPMDRVREELVEVNPIANRYIEIGDEYRDRSQSQQAIESYQQALTADPGNLKAQTNIATIHLDKKNYSAAAEAFEHALKIDDEDVVAKTGYCDSHLALGDAARKKGETEQAIAYYQKILVINAAHTDARQRLAAIYRERAESQLTTGQDDEALRSFNRAMDFTPEDDQLSARYEEVAAQKKAKVVATWLEKAEKSISRQRWDEAAEMVEEALKVDPEDKALQAKLIETKDAPRQFKLQSYRHEAEQAISRGNWDKAIAALETATLLSPENQELRDWLNSVRSDQRNAQLNLHLREAEKAIQAGDWDAALSARQAALKLNPDDPELKQALEATRQAQYQAQLDNSQKRVDEAIAAGNWDAATQAIKEAIKFAPDDATWKNKLSEVETARHQAQLKNFRSQTDSARNAQNWDAAIAALEAYLKLEPGATNIQAEIESLKTEKRESELKAFKSQAEKATQAEKWDEAVQAWEKYLALNPDDGDGTGQTLQIARKYAKIAGDYTQAQEAMRKKRYGRAIELLQGIIAEEPTYKSTSRLLVEAVEANKAIPIWRHTWIYWALGGVLLVVLGVFFGPKLWTLVSGVFTPKTAVSVGSLQDFIDSYPPTFEDDFSSQKSAWLPTQTHVNALWSDHLEIAVYDDNNDGNTVALRREHLFASNFLIQYDFMITSEEQAEAQFEIHDPSLFFRINRGGIWMIFNGDKNDDYGLAENYIPDRWNNLTILVLDNETWIYLNGEFLTTYTNTVSGEANALRAEGSSGTVSFDNLRFWDLDGYDISFQAHLASSLYVETAGIGFDPTHYVFYRGHSISWFEARDFCADLGGYLVTIGSSAEDEYIFNLTGGNIWLGATDEAEEGTWAWITGEPWTYSHWGSGQPDNYTGDNPNGENYLGMGTYGPELFYWNDSHAEGDAGIVCEWDSVAPIYTAFEVIQSLEPDYQTGFDSWDFGELPEYASIDSEKLVLTSTGEHVGVGLDIFDSSQFAIEFEVSIFESDPDGHCIFYTEGYSDPELYRSITSGFHNSGGINFALSYQQDPQEDFAYSGFDVTIPNKYTLLVLGDQLFGFIDGELAYAVRDPNGIANYNIESFAASYGITCAFDNFKAWDLTYVDFSGTSSPLSPKIKTALEFIKTQSPVYETSFDTWEWGEPDEHAKLENGKLLVSGGTDSSTFVSIANLSSDNLVVEFELSATETGPDNACILGLANGSDNEETLRALNVSFTDNGQTFLTHYTQGIYLELAAGEFETLKSNTVTIIIIGDQIANLVNGKVIFAALDPAGNALYANQLFEADINTVCEFDNFKIWDLSEVDFSSGSAFDPEKLMAYISEETPTFEDDFSAANSAWDSVLIPDLTNHIQNGMLNVPGNTYFPTNDLLSASDFALEFDLERNLDETRASILFELEFRMSSNENSYYKLSFSQKNWSFSRRNAATGEFTNFSEGNLSSTEISSSKVLVICWSGHISIYLNGELLYEVEDPAPLDGNITYFYTEYSDWTRIDNLKFWNLDGMDFSGSSMDSSGAFYIPIQAYIAENIPTFEDDFSGYKSEWGNTSQSFYSINNMLNNGNLVITQDATFDISFPINGLFNATDFALQYDYSGGRTSNVGLQFRTSSNAEQYYQFSIASYTSSWNLTYQDNTGNKLIQSGKAASGSDFKELTIILIQSQLAVLINGNIAFTAEDISQTGSVNVIRVTGESGTTVTIDNFKFWNLDEVDFTQ